MEVNIFKFLIIIIVSLSGVYATETIKVGVYENYPKIFIDKNGQAAGFFPEIVNYIAKRNNLQVEYVQCKWSECLDKLERGDIDIMPDVAYTAERNKKFSFSNEIILNSWSVIYYSRSVTVESIFDFENKTLQHLITLCKRVNFSPK